MSYKIEDVPKHIIKMKDEFSVVFWQPRHRDRNIVIWDNKTEQLIDGGWKVLCSYLDEIHTYLEKLKFYYVNARRYAKKEEDWARPA